MGKPAPISLDPQSPEFDSTDAAAVALAASFGDAKSMNERAGVLFVGPDGKYRYSTTLGGADDHFALAAQVPKGSKFAGIVHSHPGNDDMARVFSPDDLQMADTLKVPSYVRFLADDVVRRYTPGVTPTQHISVPGISLGARVAKGDALASPDQSKPDAVIDLAHALVQAKQP